jgi:16S rRNA (guanine1207-N2)-methyltransferase
MAHYYSKKQDTPLRRRSVKVTCKGHDLELSSASGIFSCRALDRGSQVLVENCIIQPGWDVLDLGCGYGVIGITLAKTYSLGRLVMCDVNERAVKMTKENIKKEGIKAEALESDQFSKITGSFDTILLNPPQSAGKDICFGMIEGARMHLKKGGILQIVARHNKGGRMLSAKMKEVFGNVRDIAKKSGYRVYVSTNINSG